MMRFRLGSLFFITFVAAVAAAGLRSESPWSAIRILAGCLASAVVPALVVGPIVQWFRKRRQARRMGMTVRGIPPWQALLWMILVGFLILVAFSLQREALLHTDGLTPWLIPLATGFGTLLTIAWIIRSRPMISMEKTSE